jgi:hypothetical protein
MMAAVHVSSLLRRTKQSDILPAHNRWHLLLNLDCAKLRAL